MSPRLIEDDRGCYLMRTTDALSRSSGLGLLRLALPSGFCADVLQQMLKQSALACLPSSCRYQCQTGLVEAVRGAGCGHMIYSAHRRCCSTLKVGAGRPTWPCMQHEAAVLRLLTPSSGELSCFPWKRSSRVTFELPSLAQACCQRLSAAASTPKA